MHMALTESGVEGQIVAAVEINTVANTVYSHNFPNTVLLNRNIQSLTANYINKLCVDAIFMSPPCQPFTRNGLKGDDADPRSCSFSHILQILPDLNVKYMLIENVKGFETSVMRDKLITALTNCHFTFQEFVLSPTQIGVSNTRHRYYCLAKKRPLEFNFTTGKLMETLPCQTETLTLAPLAAIVETNVDSSKYRVPANILLKRAMILDICNPLSKRSCCFTKAYGKYVEGTGSVFTSKSQQEIDEIYKELPNYVTDEDRYVQCIEKLQLRFFSPTEVARLMCFPNYFTFPHTTTDSQRYRLLGNSINVKLVSKLVQILVGE
ncbi:Methyltransferase 2 [Carabus blaptoides fortunei]